MPQGHTPLGAIQFSGSQWLVSFLPPAPAVLCMIEKGNAAFADCIVIAHLLVRASLVSYQGCQPQQFLGLLAQPISRECFLAI